MAGDAPKGLLRFITCGSVDDGKSTLIGRLLYEGRFLLDDQLEALEHTSTSSGGRNEPDFASLVDGLSAEREQGITIDVAYRFFATPRRSFIVADTPGHEQYTRNMATGASTAELAVILVDASRGTELQIQTRRHATIAAMIGIRHFVLAVNKMDLVDYRQSIFESLSARYLALAGELGIANSHCIPVSSLRGDNIVARSAAMPWYQGPALLPLLETIDSTPDHGVHPFRMPVQWVNRSGAGFRGYCGTVVSGAVRSGDRIAVMPSGHNARIARIVTSNGDLAEAAREQAVTIVLDREIDVSRGDVLCVADNVVATADQFAVRLLWMASEVLLPGRLYLMKIGTNTVQVSITDLKYKISFTTGEHTAAKTLQLNEIGVCNVSVDRAIPFTTYEENRDLGGFILIDRWSHQTVGMGLIDFELRRAANIAWQTLDVSRVARAAQKGQQSAVIWLTGLSGAGKSTIAAALDRRLFSLGLHSYVLDGDNIRHGLNRDLGFTDGDRVENVRRVAEVASLMADAGLLVVVSLISPFRSERDLARSLMPQGHFIEIFIDAPLALCEQRDPKGLYRKARRGEIRNFTGIESAYEAPEHPDIRIDTGSLSPEDAVDAILLYLDSNGLTRRSIA